MAHIRTHGNDTIYLEMLGSHAATSAIWAKLSGVERNGKKYKYTGEVRIGDEGIALAEGIHYKTFRREQPNKMMNLVMAHPCLSGKAQVVPYFVLTEDDKHPPSFWSKLNAAVKLPFKREWEHQLFQTGFDGLVAPHTNTAYNPATDQRESQTTQQFQKVIEPQDTRCGNLYVYEIEPNEEVWLAIIQNLRLRM